jgi:uncharacterized protein with NRDE domain
MCTLALLLCVSSRFPLIVAANRDEALARPSTTPERWQLPLPILAGRDLRAGGTWLGVNAVGLVAGLTNLWTGQPADPNRSSRGAIVAQLLAQVDLDAARAWIDAQPKGLTNPFLAICADARGRAFWTQSETAGGAQSLAPGIHVFGNSPPQASAAKLAAAARSFADAFAQRGGEAAHEILAALRPVLAAHDAGADPLQSVCVHTEHGFGTVSSSCILLGPRDVAYYHAAGPPCRSEFQSFTAPLHALLQG